MAQRVWFHIEIVPLGVQALDRVLAEVVLATAHVQRRVTAQLRVFVGGSTVTAPLCVRLNHPVRDLALLAERAAKIFVSK